MRRRKSGSGLHNSANKEAEALTVSEINRGSRLSDCRPVDLGVNHLRTPAKVRFWPPVLQLVISTTHQSIFAFPRLLARLTAPDGAQFVCGSSKDRNFRHSLPIG
jgi:hypothetical protein